MIGRVFGRFYPVHNSSNQLYVRPEGMGLWYVINVGEQNLAQALSWTDAWVLHVVGEDHQTLYGFADEPSRALAIELQKVPGVGPTTACRLAQAVAYQDLVTAIAGGDAKRLAALSSGLGPKRAAEIIRVLRPYAQACVPERAPEFDAHAQRLCATATALGFAVSPDVLRKAMTVDPQMPIARFIGEYLR